ncbi:MAG: hypothetical protein ACYTBZ_20345 [Planctomycetota bacterium]
MSNEYNNPEMMASCCGGMSGAADCRSMIKACMKKCRWCPVIPIILGILFLLLGYNLDAQITRTLWMVISGFIILMGIFGLIMTRAFCKSG